MYKLYFSFLILSFLGCKYQKNLEITIWEQNQRDYLEITTQYPNFRPVLELQMRKAKLIWQSAAKETELAQQIKKMRLANQTIHSSLGYLTQVRNKKEILKKSIFKLLAHSNLELVLKETNLFLLRIEKNLKEKEVYNENELKTYLQTIVLELEIEQNKIDEIFKKTKL